jgi:Ca2+-transporting ATPase
VFSTIPNNPIFIAVSVVTVALQIMLIEVGGEFMQTSPLTASQWLITIGLGFISIPVGILMRFIPVEEDPDSFFDNNSGRLPESPSKRVPVLERLSSPELSGDGMYKKVDDEDL